MKSQLLYWLAPFSPNRRPGQARRTLLASAGCALLALAGGCGKAPEAHQPQALAQVGDRVITADQLQRKLAERLGRQSAPATPADREAALDELVQFEALLAEARRAGVHTNADLVATFHRMVVGRFKEQQLAQLRAPAPTEGEVAAYYERHLARFTTTARLRGAILVLENPHKATPEKRDEASRKANDLREQAVQNAAATAHLGSLAQRHSVDRATRYTGGDFGPLTPAEIEGRYGAALAQALAALSAPGEISPVVETPMGLGFVKFMERTPAARRPLAEVRDVIARELAHAKQAQAERDFLSATKEKAGARINRPLLDSIPLPSRNDEPPSLPGARNYTRNEAL